MSNQKNGTNTQVQEDYSLDEIKTLVGYESKSINVSALASDDKTSSSGDLIDDSDFEEEGPTKRKLWQIGWVKMAVIGIPLGVIAFITAFILVNISSMKLSDKPVQVEPANDGKSPEDVAAIDQKEEIAQLKTANALGNQASVLESQSDRQTEIRPQQTIERQQVRAREADPKATQQPIRQAETVPVEAIRSRPVAVPRMPVEPRMPAAPRFSQTPTPPTVTRVVQAPPNVSNTAASQDSVDPFEAWQRLASLGSYGKMPASEAISSANSSTVSSNYSNVQAPSNQPIPIMVSRNTAEGESFLAAQADSSEYRPLPKAMKNNGSTTAQLQQVSNTTNYEVEGESSEVFTEAGTSQNLEDVELFAEADQAAYQDGVSFIMGDRPSVGALATEVLPGSSARGEVVSPVAWAADSGAMTGAIELTEDLVSDGSVIVSSGSQLIVEVRSMSETGMMDLAVTSIVLSESGYEDMRIPPSAIAIRGGNGNVLMAKDKSGVSSELNRIDRSNVLLGALGQVGAVLNRPNSQSSAANSGGVVSSTDYGSPNILGAVLEGGANAMIRERTTRNQARADELQDRPFVWVLESGTDVEIFVSERIPL
jgi:Bacterial conjugation TrbI-like protein